MLFRPTNCPTTGAKRSRQGFTLAEVLAALVFMAIVIPVAVEGVRIANQAGVVSERQAVAMQIAERVLNEYVATGQVDGLAQRGTIERGFINYRWAVLTEAWPEDSMQVVTAEVLFPAQGKEYDVRLSTLVDNSAF